jgi:hypothetical protein
MIIGRGRHREHPHQHCLPLLRVLTGSRLCARPAFSRAFFLVVVPWLPDVPEGHLTPFGVLLGVCNGSCATPVVVVNNVGGGVLYDVRVL